MHESTSRESTFGYVSTLQSAQHGYFGGYLILSTFGRPLEFHCTSPVRPSRAQEILYGPTLQPYLLGEQITGALLAAATRTPRLILTDQPAIISMRESVPVPLVLLVGAAEAWRGRESLDRENGPGSRAADGGADARPLALPHAPGQVRIGGQLLELPAGFGSEQNVLVEALHALSEHVELAEPFGRIHEAIHEAQRIGGRSTEAHGEAA